METRHLLTDSDLHLVYAPYRRVIRRTLKKVKTSTTVWTGSNRRTHNQWIYQSRINPFLKLKILSKKRIVIEVLTQLAQAQTYIFLALKQYLIFFKDLTMPVTDN